MKRFLKIVFSRERSKALSKEEYWRKWEFFDLLVDLHEAEKQLLEIGEGHSGEFLSMEEFHEALIDAIDEIEGGNQTNLSKFWVWFSPTSVWDDFVGVEGMELGIRIFERVDRWKKGSIG